MKRPLLWLVVSLAIGGIIYASIRDAPWFACSAEQRITTVERAMAFGRAYLINDKRFWEGNEVTSLSEIEAIIAGQPKPAGTAKGDYFINDDSRWGVGFGIYKKGYFDFDYEVFFDECGRNARVEKFWVNKGE